MAEMASGTEATRSRVPLPLVFWEFLKLGLTAFGGPAIIAHIRALAVDRRGWLDAASFKEGVVLSQSIPGATAMQVAAFVGLKSRGVKGAAAAYLGLGLPAFFLMVALSRFYTESRTIAPVLAVFGGLQVVVVAIVAHASITFGKEIAKNRKALLLAALSVLVLACGVNAFWAIAASAWDGTALFPEIVPPPATAGPEGWRIIRKRLLVSAVLVGAGLVLLRFIHPQLFTLSALMLKINFLAFGGGLSALPLIHDEIVAAGWIESNAFMDGIALGQVTPGPISITGTFIGYLLFGMNGALAATLATFSPSFILLVASEPCFERLKSSRVVACATRGIFSCFVGLLCYVAYRFAVEIPWDLKRLLLLAVAFVALLRSTGLLLVVLLGAIYSVIFL